MEIYCPLHGTVESVTVDGYNIGHVTSGPNELDLEGIEFEFTVDEDGVNVHVSDRAENYLSKFSDWQEDLKNAFQVMGRVEITCPKCGAIEVPTWVLEDGEEKPEWEAPDHWDTPIEELVDEPPTR